VDGLQFNMSLVDKLQQQIDKILTGRIYSMSVAALEQSGASKRMDNVCQENFSSYLADQVLRFAPSLVNLFGAYLGMEDIEVETYSPDEFIVQDRDADRLDATYFSTNYQAETSRQWIAQQKRIRKLSGLETMMSKEDIDADNEELATKAEKLFTDQPISDHLHEPQAGDDQQDEDMADEAAMAKNTQGGDASAAGTGEQVEE